jgi:two-component system NtrC family sensor kinase
MTDPKLIAILRKVDLFHDVPAPVLDQLAPLVTLHEYKENQLVIRKGDEGDSLYIIASGRVRVHDGELVVATMESGNFFGEISFLDTAPRSMSVSADVTSVLYRISREDFYKVFNNQPEVFQKIVSTLTQRLRSQNERVINDLKMREAELTRLVEERTRELVEKNDQLSDTLEELKSTQERLVRQEKLASLGQLTAGIAHEIKNPLNFVNNFAKLSFELVEELIDLDSKEEREEVGQFLRQNLQKIHEHGSRADGIVKGMLDHTRTGGEGTRQLTDINRMSDQVIEIVLNDMSKKWPGFAPQIIRDYSEDMPRVAVAAVDFSKMILNLLNNAFYALHERIKQNEAGFVPAVTVSTGISNNRLILSVKDNGPGIPIDIRDVIFNPFFTTKPTGEGAGLGLSISTDIIISHGGTIICESEIGAGTVFVVSMPAQ